MGGFKIAEAWSEFSASPNFKAWGSSSDFADIITVASVDNIVYNPWIFKKFDALPIGLALRCRVRSGVHAAAERPYHCHSG